VQIKSQLLQLILQPSDSPPDPKIPNHPGMSQNHSSLPILDIAGFPVSMNLPVLQHAIRL